MDANGNGFYLIFRDRQGRAEVTHITDTSGKVLEGTIVASEKSKHDIGYTTSHNKQVVIAYLLSGPDSDSLVSFDITLDLDLI